MTDFAVIIYFLMQNMYFIFYQDRMYHDNKNI